MRFDWIFVGDGLPSLSAILVGVEVVGWVGGSRKNVTSQTHESKKKETLSPRTETWNVRSLIYLMLSNRRTAGMLHKFREQKKERGQKNAQHEHRTRRKKKARHKVNAMSLSNL